MKILGISAYCTNASACLVIDGEVLAAAREERFTRIRGDASFPANAIDFCLNYCNLELKDLDAIALHDKPFLRFERLLETHYAFAPRGLRSFLASMPMWIHEKVFLRSRVYRELKKLRNSDPRKIRLLFSEHHLSHAAGAFYTSPFEEAAILVIDSVGEWATTSIGHAHQSKIKIIKELRYPHSLGILYNSFTTFLGIGNWSCQDRLSALATRGIGDAKETQHFIKVIKENLVSIKNDGSINLNQSYFRYTTGSELIDEQKWEALFKMPCRQEMQELDQQHHNLALSIKTIIEEVIMKLCREASQITGSENLCLSGDVSADGMVEGAAKKSGLFKNIIIQHAPSDDGASIGAALAAQHLYFKQKRSSRTLKNGVFNSCLGPGYEKAEIMSAIESRDFQYYYFRNENALLAEVADLLSQNKIIALFRGRMEFEMESSGNRSIIALAGYEETRKRFNKNVKGRDEHSPLKVVSANDTCKNHFLNRLLGKLNENSHENILWKSSMGPHGEPVVCTPEEALRFFQNSDIDYLVMDCYLISKELNVLKHRESRTANFINN
jgi:carbamoyltransferase